MSYPSNWHARHSGMGLWEAYFCEVKSLTWVWASFAPKPDQYACIQWTMQCSQSHSSTTGAVLSLSPAMPPTSPANDTCFLAVDSSWEADWAAFLAFPEWVCAAFSCACCFQQPIKLWGLFAQSEPKFGSITLCKLLQKWRIYGVLTLPIGHAPGRSARPFGACSWCVVKAIWPLSKLAVTRWHAPYPLDLKRLSETCQKLIGWSLFVQINGPAWLYSPVEKTALQPISVIISGSPQQEVHMDSLLMQVWTSFMQMGLAHCRNGWTTTFSFAFSNVTSTHTTPNVSHGIRQSQLTEEEFMRAAAYGTEEILCQMDVQKSLMRTWLPPYVTSHPPPNALPLMKSLHMQMQILTTYLKCLAYHGNRPKQSHLALLSLTWASFGISRLVL